MRHDQFTPAQVAAQLRRLKRRDEAHAAADLEAGRVSVDAETRERVRRRTQSRVDRGLSATLPTKADQVWVIDRQASARVSQVLAELSREGVRKTG